jgi:hypothetical protein
VDVPNGEVHESPKRVCSKHGTFEGNMAMGYSIEEALGFYIKYIQKVKSTRRKVWDDKEKPTMHNEVLERNGCPHKLSVDLRAWAHTFVLHNAIATKPWK